MKYMKRIIVLVTGVLLLCGCSVTRIEKVKAAKDSATEFIGIGVGESFDYNTAKMFAENAARGELSRKIMSRVKTFTEEYAAQHSTSKGKRAPKGQYENIAETYVSASADNTFSSYEKSHKVSRNRNKYVYWVCFAASKGKVAEEIIGGQSLKDMDESTRQAIAGHRDEFVKRMTR